MRFVSQVNKPIQENIQAPAKQQKRNIVIPDESSKNDFIESFEASNPQEPINESQENILEDPREKFKKIRELSKSQELKISDQEKNILEALLGFGLADKKIDLWKNNVKYTFILKNFDDETLREYTKERVDLDNYVQNLSKSTESEEEKAKLGVDYIFESRILTLSYAIQEILIGDPINKKFTPLQISNYLNVPDFKYLLRTWGEEPVKKIFEAYSELNKEISNSLNNESKLTENLKK